MTDPDRNPADRGDDVWMGDCVEIFVDHDANFETDPPFYDEVGTRQFFVGAPDDDASNGDRAAIRIPLGIYNDWDQSSWVAVPTAFGYVVEVFIDAADLDLSSLSLVAGQSVGIDLAHDVSVAPGETGHVVLTLESAEYSGEVRESAVVAWLDQKVAVTTIDILTTVKPLYAPPSSST